jgi:hypothetical protein
MDRGYFPVLAGPEVVARLAGLADQCIATSMLLDRLQCTQPGLDPFPAHTTDDLETASKACVEAAVELHSVMLSLLQWARGITEQRRSPTSPASDRPPAGVTPTGDSKA